MFPWSESKRSALNPEEAALLPAMPRHKLAGNAALRGAMQAAEKMGRKRLSNEVEAGMDQHKMPVNRPATQGQRHRDRAALHHVLKQ